MCAVAAHPYRSLIFGSILIGLGGLLSSQDFRTDVRVVEVTIIARDKGSQKPVTGLTKDDFTLLDAGQKQTLTAVETFSWRTGAVPEVQPVSGWLTNRKVGVAADGPPVIAVMVDGYNSRFEDTHDAMKAVRKVLENSAWKGAIFGLFLVDQRGIHVLQDWTDSAEALAAQARTRGVFTASGADPQGLAPEAGEVEERLRLLQALGGMEAIGGHMQSVPRRRSIVWLTSGFPMNLALKYSSDWERAIERLSAMDVAVYPVDAAGLRLLPGFSASVGASQGARWPGPGGRGGRTRDNIDMMLEMAARTGGVAFYNSNNLAQGLKQAFDDDQVVYRLYFQPNHGKWDGHYRRIEVKTQRKGVELRYRAGYRAFPVNKELEQRPVEVLAAAPLDSTGIGLSMRLQSRPDGVVAQLVADAAGLELEPRNGLSVGRFEVLGLLLRSDGSLAKDWKQRFTVEFTPEALAQLKTNGFAFEQAVPAGVEYARVRILLTDLRSGKTGSLTVPALEPVKN
ncbi:VWA domain-containing protein [Paludibaculum fermentans]|uniref:VWA domain-containing protein n=1 Tax=Paludibaculum fermentans TaxID=1473598 RepID=UPI003EBAA971